MDLDRLEQLDRLRQSGALTEEEFQAQKAELAKPAEAKPASGWQIAAIFGAGVTLLAGFGLAAIYWPDAGPKSSDRGVEAVSPASVQKAGSKPENEAVKPAPKGKQSLFSWATSADVLGVTPAFLRSKLGVPKYQSRDDLTFDVDGCEVEYSIGNSMVKSYSTEITARCQPVVFGVRLDPRTKFSKLPKGGTLVADCLSSCGNAADPTIDLYYPGSRARGFVGHKVHGKWGDTTYEALDTWEKHVRAVNNLPEFEYVEGVFSCVTNPPANVASAARGITVSWVTVGDVSAC